MHQDCQLPIKPMLTLDFVLPLECVILCKVNEAQNLTFSQGIQTIFILLLLLLVNMVMKQELPNLGSSICKELSWICFVVFQANGKLGLPLLGEANPDLLESSPRHPDIAVQIHFLVTQWYQLKSAIRTLTLNAFHVIPFGPF
jgi:hypothetical protein